LSGDAGPPCLLTPETVIGAVAPYAVCIKHRIWLWAAISRDNFLWKAIFSDRVVEAVG
jgi:hypothetical protein